MAVRTLVLLTAILLSEGIALAQPNLRIVSYPIAELVIPISANRESAKNATSENELMAHLRKSIAPATWEQSGGQGTMRYEPKDYFLHVCQTPEVHAELKSFLAQLLREQVSVEVRVVTVSANALEELRGAWTIQWTKKDGIESALLDEARVYRFLETVQGDRTAHIVQLPKITLFDGQEATMSGGVQARLLPTISADRRYVTVQAEISRPNSKEADAKAQIPQPAFNEIKVAVVAKMPDQRTLAILAATTTLMQVRTETPSPLSRIPYVSRLDRNVGYNQETVKLIVLLTPRIVREEETMDTVEVRPLRAPFHAADNGKFPLILPQNGK